MTRRRVVALAPLLLMIALPGAARSQEPAPPTPGPAHDALHQLQGGWEVQVGDDVGGTATGHPRLDGRFLEVELTLNEGPIRHALYTFGFDRRHDEYTVVAMDDTGTYFVTAKGAREGDRVVMYGQDDEPVMTAMGFEKEFVIVLRWYSDNRIGIETLFIDTRTPARTEMPFIEFVLERGEELPD